MATNVGRSSTSPREILATVMVTEGSYVVPTVGVKKNFTFRSTKTIVLRYERVCILTVPFVIIINIVETNRSVQTNRIRTNEP